MEQEPRNIAASMTGRMKCTLLTGSSDGTRVIGQTVTRKALRARDLIDDSNRWTSLGWAVALWIANNEPGWNPAHFRSVDEVHAEALAEDLQRFPVSGNDGDLTQEQATPATSWRPIPGAYPGDLRCAETGVEIRAVRGLPSWEVLIPQWQDGRKVMRVARMVTTKIEALGHVGRTARREARERIQMEELEAQLRGPEVTLFSAPYPPMSSTTNSAGCYADSPDGEGWTCTRESGHDGAHEAGDGLEQKMAEWPA